MHQSWGERPRISSIALINHLFYGNYGLLSATFSSSHALVCSLQIIKSNQLGKPFLQFFEFTILPRFTAKLTHLFVWYKAPLLLYPASGQTSAQLLIFHTLLPLLIGMHANELLRFAWANSLMPSGPSVPPNTRYGQFDDGQKNSLHALFFTFAFNVTSVP